ncbi:MAG: hypothetical protein WBB86_06125 [Candidatus Omnitrophota bacterium]
MGMYGKSSSRLIQQFPIEEVKQAIELILRSWESFKTKVNLEDKITNKFYAHLIENKSRSTYFFTIVPRPAEIDEQGEEIGEIDLKIICRNQEKTYFSFECKRLRVRFPSSFHTLAGKYVTEGMYRYFNGQYARNLDKGGMLGYVMDGNIDVAVNNVEAAIDKRHSSLYMEENETLKASACITSKQVKETIHKYGPTKRFTIYHVFLPMNITPNIN